MRILIISDIHGKTEGLSGIRDRIEPVDLVIAAGDLTHFGSSEDALRVVEELKKIHPEILAIAGNCDNREIEAMLVRKGFAPGSKGIGMGGMRFYGLSGALPGPVKTPYERSEEDIEAALTEIESSGSETLVLISHQPPHGSVADRVMHLKHVGSRSLRSWIDRNSPALVICGHIHESHGHGFLGSSQVVNPGAFKDGRYAVLDLDGSSGQTEFRMEKV